jgi:hypothetical protein
MSHPTAQQIANLLCEKYGFDPVARIPGAGPSVLVFDAGVVIAQLGIAAASEFKAREPEKNQERA